MLAVYRRHRKKCKFTADRTSRRCRCPLWLTGTLLGEAYRKTAKTRSFEAAEQIKRKLEDGSPSAVHATKISIEDALAAFIADCESRNLNKSTLAKYELLARRVLDYATNHGLFSLDQLTHEHALRFRGTWRGSPLTLRKALDRARAIGNFAVENGWISANPFKKVKAPITYDKPVEPFSEKEQRKILDAAYKLSRREMKPKGNASPVHPYTGTFAKLLLRTGLRITDASTLTKERIQNGRIFLYAQKNKRPVTLPLQPDLLAELDSIPSHNVFQSPQGSQRPETVSDYWRDQLAKVFDVIGVKKGHPHQFRHSLAVNMLNAGSSVEDVALVLGNSPAIVSKHYSAFVESRQQRLDAEIMKAWKITELVRVK